MITNHVGSAQASQAQSEQWASPFESLLKEAGMPNPTVGSATIQQPDPTIGSPQQDSRLFPGQQSYSDTCAIRCQEYVLTQFWGCPIDEGALVHEAMDHGWYTPGGGTQLVDIGNLLELHGIGVNRYAEATVFHLANELAQGHKVIIGVDSGELWNQHPILEKLEDFFGTQGADHAVVVSGIDTSDPNDVHVIVSDPGTGEAVASYPMTQFLDAWADSQFFMVATQEPPPQALHLPEMANFDYGLGHLPYVAGMPYDQFLTLEDQPELWASLTLHASTAIEPDSDEGFKAPDTQTSPEDHQFWSEAPAGCEEYDSGTDQAECQAGHPDLDDGAHLT